LDTTTSLAVVWHAIDFFEKQGIFFDAVCLLQPTNPFRDKGFIDKAIQKFAASGADSLVSVLPVPHEYNPHWVFEPDTNGFLKIATGEGKIIPRRQDLPKAYHRDGSVYITKTDAIKSGSLYGEQVVFIESHPDLYTNIDTPEDWNHAESLLKNPQTLRLIEQ
jgi:N-acylneuraminate cytidylyltransferase